MESTNAIIHDVEHEQDSYSHLDTQPLGNKKDKEKTNTQVIPAHIREKFIELNNSYYYPEQTQTPAFVDHGNNLNTDLTNEKLTKTLIDIAHAREWKKIRVQGNKAFKRDAWLQASAIGISVSGYEPTEMDLAELKRRSNTKTNSHRNINASFNAEPPGDVNESLNENLTRGVVVEHGKQHYNYDPSETKSYVVKIKDDNGTIHTKWGKELGHEIKAKKVNPGDKIDIIFHGKKPVTVKKPIRDENGKVTDYETINTHRNKWEIQTEKSKALAQSFENGKDDPVDLAAKEPKLNNAATTVAVAHKFADEKIENTETREKFLKAVSTSLKKDIAAGNSIHKVNSQEQIITKETEIER